MSHPSPAFRSDNLQILRFVAAGLVLLTHITFYIHERISTSFNIWHNGESGVPIFFVISGFVMHLSSTKLPLNAQGGKVFLHRRFTRILPLYWLITTLKLTVALAIPAAVLHNHPQLMDTLASYALFPTFNEAHQIRPLHGVAWTLLHEMLFYYVFTLAMVLRLPPALFSSVVLLGMWGYGLFVPVETALAHVCISGMNLMFIAGMLMSIWYLKGGRLPAWFAALLLLTGLVAMLGLVHPQWWPWSAWSVLSWVHRHNVDAALIVLGALHLPTLPLPFIQKKLVALGDSSYSLYLIHPLLAPAVCVALSRVGVETPMAIIPLAFATCVIASHLAYLFIERPMNDKARGIFGRILFIPKTTPSGSPSHSGT